MNTVKMIKPDATTSASISTGLLQKFQQLFSYLTANKTAEEIEKFKTEMSQHTKIDDTFSEEWMIYVKILGMFIHEVEKQFINEGKTFDKEMEDIIDSSINL
jgi:hypothetical protein